MSREDVETVRRMYEAFHGGDAEAALACFDAGVVTDASRRVDGWVGHGREELARIVNQWVGAFEEWGEEIEEMRELGGRVYVLSTQRGRGRGSGTQVESRYALLYEVRSGRIARMTLYTDPGEALEAPGFRGSRRAAAARPAGR